ncbi:MAG: fumarylacetoacetate hydrolase family protein [Microbispora sp.]|nr:fumarylacetoacetate hydrolase family protein [Microbispora sp.]
MKLATIRTADGTRAVRVDDDTAVDLGCRDLAEVLRRPGWREYAAAATGKHYDLTTLRYAPVVVAPEKIICVGVNYRAHIEEMGREIPAHPTLFAKYARALIGAYDDVMLPESSAAMDWEAELALVIGDTVRHAGPEQARAAIAGFTVINDVTARDWQYRTLQWLQGKTFEATTPIGPYLVTDGSGRERIAFDVVCEVDGEVVQRANTEDLVFDPPALVAYVSTIVTLVPGDVIATGTPGGVGHARRPPRYLTEGTELVTRIEGIGELRNTCRVDRRAG